MSIKAFNQYMDMYFEKYPTPLSEEIGEAFRELEASGNPRIASRILFANMNNNILVYRHPFFANGKLEAHSHDYFELIYLSRGHGIQTVNGVSCDMKAGDLCLLSPEAKHSIAIDTPDDMLFNIMIRPSLFQTSFPSMIAGNDLISNFFYTSLFTASSRLSFLYFPQYESLSIHNYVQTLIREFYEQQMGYEKAMECQLALLFTELMRGQKEKIDEENFELMGNNQLSSILSYINTHKADATLSSVAEKFHYHPNYLSALIKKYTNKTFSELLQEAKLQEVCYYLKNTDMPINEIIQSVGYYDRSYFNRVFKKHFHKTPVEYRESAT